MSATTVLRWTDVEQAERRILTLYRRGRPRSEIARRVGMTGRSVGGVITRLRAGGALTAG